MRTNYKQIFKTYNICNKFQTLFINNFIKLFLKKKNFNYIVKFLI